MVVLSHRANLEGPRPGLDNGLKDCQRVLELGFGLETDLRRDVDGHFYISHDPARRTKQNDFTSYEAVFREFPDRVIAMNVKELGYESELIRLYAEGCLGLKAFYFDFELLQPQMPGAAQQKLKTLPGGLEVKVAARLSDRGESLEQCLSISAEVVWADEFDSLWITWELVQTIRETGRKIYMISPELHGFPIGDVLRRWKDFKSWGVDGVCTDYALAARDFFLP
jgi:glycerophosphoryl diester phosphodiesterase